MAQKHCEAGQISRETSETSVDLTDVYVPVLNHLTNFTASKYSIEKTLSKTLQGSVMLAKCNQDSKECAIKIAELKLATQHLSGNGRRVAENVFHEYQIMKRLSEFPHENVLRMFDAHCDEENLYLVLEYCANGEFFGLIENCEGQGVEESLAKEYFMQITRGLHHLHRLNIAHLDLSLENIFVDHENKLKIADFGVAREFKEGDVDIVHIKSRHERPGKQTYMSPEIYKGLPFRAKQADVFSLGVVLFTMCYGFPPFETAAMSDPRYQRITQYGLKSLLKDWKLESKISASGVDLISRMLTSESDRITLDEILAHPWMEQ